MGWMTNKNLPLIFFGIFFWLLTEQAVLSESSPFNGFTDIVRYRDRYIAVGTDGRIDCISGSGKSVTIDSSGHIKLNCAFSNDEILIITGNHGTLLYSSDGKDFCHAQSGTKENINCVTSGHGLILAGADRGIILISKDGISWNQNQTNAKGHILSLTAGRSFFMGITDAGEIIKSFDGIHWKINDYNQDYAGYNRPSLFKKILSAQNRIVIIGTHDDGSPSILFSSLGNVWAERTPVFHDEQGLMDVLKEAPNDITYDSGRDQFILACDHGELFSLPNCEKCNEMMKIAEYDLKAIFHAGDGLLIAGDEYTVFFQRL